MKKNKALPGGEMTGMNAIQVFNYKENDVRTVQRDGEPWFVLKDVCQVLGISDHKVTVRRLDQDEVCQTPLTDKMGRMQETTIINESGLYTVILRSDKSEAKNFRKWVTSEVLPSIRKHGAYLTPETIEAAIVNPDIMIQLCNTIKAERAQKEALQAQALADRPKVQFAEAVEASSGSVKVGDFAKMVSKRNGVQIGQNKLYKWMRDKKILTRDNIPYQRYMKAGYFEVSEFLLCGRPVKMTYITGKGQTYLYKRLRGSELSA